MARSASGDGVRRQGVVRRPAPALPVVTPTYPPVDLDGVTELRIHGVSGTPIEKMLRHPHPFQVTGDEVAGVYRGGPGHEPWPPEAASVDHLEGYSWGRLTAGSASRALWLLLLPFTLVNVAAWAHPYRPKDRYAPVGTMSGLLRALALSMTGTMILAAATIGMDLTAWQCAGDKHHCGDRHFYTRWFGADWLNTPGRHVVAGALVPLLTLVAMWALSRRTGRAYEDFPPDGHHHPATDWSTPGLRDLAKPAFWSGGAPLMRLRSLHLTAGFAALAALIAYATSRGDDSGWRRPAEGLSIGCLVLIGIVALLLLSPLTGRRRQLLEAESQAPHFADVAMRWSWPVGLAALVLAGVYAFAWAPTQQRGGELPGLVGSIEILVFVQIGLVVLLLLANAVALERSAKDSDVADETLHHWRMFFGFGPTVAACWAIALVAAYAAGTTFRVADALGRPHTFVSSEPVNPHDLRLPDQFVWVGQAFVATAAAALVVAVAVLVLHRVLGHVLQSSVRAEYGLQPPEDREQARRVKAIAKVQASARLTDHGHWLILLLLGLAVGMTAFLIPLDYHLDSSPSLSFLANAGSWAVGLFLVGLVGLGRAAYRNERLRRTVGIVWDLGTFWPRSAHPFAPPCYAERAVPELVRRMRQLLRSSGRVILSAHSQGSIIGFAALAQLNAAERKCVSFLTYGCPLERLYARSFAQFFSVRALREMRAGLDDRWRNLYRRSDPIGGPVFALDVPGCTPTPDGDVLLTDPEFARETWALDDPVPLRHSDYFHDFAFRAAAEELAGQLRTGGDCAQAVREEEPLVPEVKPEEPPPSIEKSAIDTWRYLRVAMVVVIIGLGVAVGYERAHAHASCFQTSLSAYYYTPVRAVFVSMLVALGLAMVCLKGSTDPEDILLNLAGMFAPVVAFVPTPHVGTCPASTRPQTTPLSDTQRALLQGGADPNIANNIFALLAIGAVGLAVVGTLLLVRRRQVRWEAFAGYGAAFAVYVAALVVFNANRGWFNDNAHYYAAALLFACIIAVVVANARGYRDKKGLSHLFNRYAFIAGAMVLSLAVILIVHFSDKSGWAHWLLVLEVTLISLFAVFWGIQTVELWSEGLRRSSTAEPDRVRGSGG